MKYSTNYNMNKPELSEQYRLSHWNENTDIIDSAMQAIRSGTDEVMRATLLNFCYPVGSLYWSSKSTNPATLFGGTWVQIKDRFVLACGDTYTSVDATGGASIVTLSVSNMPSHTHSFTPSGSVSSHSHGLNGHTHSFTPSGNISSNGGHRHGPSKSLYNTYRPDGGGDSGNAPGYLSYFLNNPHWYNSSGVNNDATINRENSSSSTASSSVDPMFTGYAGYHNHTFSGSAGTTGPAGGNTTSTAPTFTGNAGTTGSNGSGSSFSILPPYVVKYCFERTA